MKKLNIKVLSASWLKILAMACMLCDHMWATVIPGNLWLTMIGRLAFPIFSFQLVEGFFHTGDVKRYTRRMLLFALISELPFNLMTGGSLIYPFHQNVMFTFWLALLILRMIDRTRHKRRVVFILYALLWTFLGYLLGFLLMADYYGYGILMVLLFYFCRNLPFQWVFQLAGMVFINAYMMQGRTIPISLHTYTLDLPIQAFAILALIPLWLYNGKPGRYCKVIRPVCYVFYPLHILILSVIWLYVIN